MEQEVGIHYPFVIHVVTYTLLHPRYYLYHLKGSLVPTTWCKQTLHFWSSRSFFAPSSMRLMYDLVPASLSSPTSGNDFGSIPYAVYTVHASAHSYQHVTHGEEVHAVLEHADVLPARGGIQLSLTTAPQCSRSCAGPRANGTSRERVQPFAHVLVVEHRHYISLLRVLHEIQRQRPLNRISVVLLLLSTR